MQSGWIFQRGIGFIFLVVIDQTKRVVEVSYLTHIQGVNIASRPGGDIPTPVKISD
ncbi:hypothetical protein D3C75_1367490 [compost metagenome]